MLDVHFGEDKVLLWKNDAAENMAAIRKLVINMLKTYKKNNGLKKTINVLIKSASWTTKGLTRILDSWIYSSS